MSAVSCLKFAARTQSQRSLKEVPAAAGEEEDDSGTCAKEFLLKTAAKSLDSAFAGSLPCSSLLRYLAYAGRTSATYFVLLAGQSSEKKKSKKDAAKSSDKKKKKSKAKKKKKDSSVWDDCSPFFLGNALLDVLMKLKCSKALTARTPRHRGRLFLKGRLLKMRPVSWACRDETL